MAGAKIIVYTRFRYKIESFYYKSFFIHNKRRYNMDFKPRFFKRSEWIARIT